MSVDVWIPDPYSTARDSHLASFAWGRKLVLSMMAGTEWIPPLVGPHVTICNAHGAHNVATAEWTVAAILSMLKYFPLYLDIQRSGNWMRRFEASNHYSEITRDSRPHSPPVMLEELTGKTVLMVGYGSIGKDIERMLAPYCVEMVRVARNARSGPKVHAVGELNALIPLADVIVLILPNTSESHGLIGKGQFALMRQGALLVNAARGPIVRYGFALVEALQSVAKSARHSMSPIPNRCLMAIRYGAAPTCSSRRTSPDRARSLHPTPCAQQLEKFAAT